MRWTVPLTFIGVILLGAPAAAECLGSARAVWRDHPHSHATWNLIDGRHCWRAGVPSAHRQHRGRYYGMVSAPAIPLPPPSPRGHVTPAQGRALMLYVLGE